MPEIVKAVDEMYCSSCGEIIKKDAVICVKCGVQIKRFSPSISPRKTKSTAVLLAIFFGFWTWLYTYKVDYVLFWINLVMTLCTFGLWVFVAGIWAIIHTCGRPSKFFDDYSSY